MNKVCWSVPWEQRGGWQRERQQRWRGPLYGQHSTWCEETATGRASEKDRTTASMMYCEAKRWEHEASVCNSPCYHKQITWTVQSMYNATKLQYNHCWSVKDTGWGRANMSVVTHLSFFCHFITLFNMPLKTLNRQSAHKRTHKNH